MNNTQHNETIVLQESFTKKSINGFLAIFTLLIACFCLFSSCDNQIKKIPQGPDKAPESWMYSQRAFPNGINREAKNLALKQLHAMNKSNNSRFEKPWEQVGPINIGGRITDISLDPTDMNIIYASSATGGLWKSSDKGYTWELVFEEEGSISIGNVEVSPSNPNIVYVGTGEANGSATSGAFFGN